MHVVDEVCGLKEISSEVRKYGNAQAAIQHLLLLFLSVQYLLLPLLLDEKR